MKPLLSALAVTVATSSLTSASDFDFHPPRILKSAEGVLKAPSPGYACPCWADIDGDGRNELLVGQFSSGRIRVFEHRGDGLFEGGDYLQVNGGDAKIPGVW
jgi:hypothetical protein